MSSKVVTNATRRADRVEDRGRLDDAAIARAKGLDDRAEVQVRIAIGAIPMRNCTFRNCQFHTLGITGSDELLQMLVDQVAIAG